MPFTILIKSYYAIKSLSSNLFIFLCFKFMVIDLDATEPNSSTKSIGPTFGLIKRGIFFSSFLNQFPFLLIFTKS